MLKKVFLALLVAVLFTGCDLNSDKQGVAVKIQATGELMVKPDIAEFIVTASCVNKKISISNTCIKKKIDMVFNILEKNEISKDDFHSSRVELEKNYDWIKNSRVFRGYETSTTIVVEVKDLNKLDALLGALMVHENLTVSGLTYSHSKLDELENDAYVKALENAKLLAKKLKDEIGGKSIEIIEVNNTGEPLSVVASNVKSLRKGEVADTYNSPSPIGINVGMLVLQKNIRVQFLIKK